MRGARLPIALAVSLGLHLVFWAAFWRRPNQVAAIAPVARSGSSVPVALVELAPRTAEFARAFRQGRGNPVAPPAEVRPASAGLRSPEFVALAQQGPAVPSAPSAPPTPSRHGPGPAPAPGSGGGAASATADPLLVALVQALQASARGCYPPQAARFNLRGTASLRFCLDSSGTPSALRVASSTGSALLDRAAVDCVVPRAQPLPKRPGCYTVPVEFGGP